MNKTLADIIVAKFEKCAAEELQKLSAVNPQVLSAIESISRGDRLPLSMMGAGLGAGAGAVTDEDSALKGALIGGGIGGLTPLAWKGIEQALTKVKAVPKTVAPGAMEKVPGGVIKMEKGVTKLLPDSSKMQWVPGKVLNEGSPAEMSNINDLIASLGLKGEDQAQLIKALGAAGKSNAPAEAVTRGVQYGALGAATGAATGENNKDRLRRALIGGSLGAGAGAGSAVGRLIGRNAPKGTELATRLAGTAGGGVGGYYAGKSMVGKKKKK